MTTDGLNALDLRYNYLNLLGKVESSVDGSALASYKWLADGTKVGVKDGAGTQGLEYIGSLIYKRVNGELQLEGTSFGGGRIEVSESVDGNIYTPNYYVTDHLGSTRAIWDGTPNIVRSNFTPFGTRWNDAQASTSRYQFTGYEDQPLLDNKLMDAGARFFSPILPIYGKIDDKAEEYYPWSPYAYCYNNPINAIDPDGKDGYLIIWLTADGHIGHAGFAIDNYTQQQVLDDNGNAVLDENGNATYEMVKDGTVSYMDLWPGNEGGVGMKNAGDDVVAHYGTKTTTLDDIMNTDITGNEHYAPQGVVKIATDYATDQKAMKAMSEFMETKIYNGRDRNCSDFAKLGVETSMGIKIYAQENILGKSSTTPNALYRATVTVGPITTVLKNPGPKVNNTFIQGMKGR